MRDLKDFAPFGIGNPTPQVLARGLKVVDIKILKNAHIKCTLSDGKKFISALLWRHNFHPALHEGAVVDVVFKPDVSTYGGLTDLQANIQAVQLSI